MASVVLGTDVVGATVGVVADRTLPFARPQAARLDVIAPPDVGAAVAETSWCVRSLTTGRSRMVDTDPMAPRPVPLVRAILNGTATFLLVVVAGLVVVAAVPRLFGYGSVVVVSGSMEPSIRVADVVVTSPSDGENLPEGAVIDFDHADGSRLHRIEAITETGYRTAGDANATADSELVSADQVRGVGVVVVPFVGLPALWIERGQWLPLAGVGLAIALAAYMSRSRWVDPQRPLLQA